MIELVRFSLIRLRFQAELLSFMSAGSLCGVAKY